MSVDEKLVAKFLTHTDDTGRFIVSSTRTGIDTFWSPLRGLDTSHIEFSLIGSAFTESTRLKRLDTPTSADPYIGEFTYRQNYLSIGFALAW